MLDYSVLNKVENNTCLICNSNDQSLIGVRGNREYSGANPIVKPHVQTNVVKCGNCGFIFINPQLQGSEILENHHYSSEITYKTSNTSSIDEMFKRRVDMILPYKKNGKVLDVGSGRGEFLKVFKGLGYETQGVEPSEGLYTYSIEKNNIECFNGKLENYNLEEKFDVITSIHSLEHMDNPRSFLIESSKRLKRDGILMIEVPNTESYFLHIIDFYFKITSLNWSSRLSPLHPPFHKYGYNKKALSYLLTNEGFNVVKVLTVKGSDRGYDSKKSVSLIISSFRKLTSVVLNVFGNREILIVLASLK